MRQGNLPFSIMVDHRCSFTATFAENSSAKAFAEFLKEGDLTLDIFFP